MRTNSMLVVGFLAAMAVTGTTNASDGFASDGHRVDVIDALHETVVQKDSARAGGRSTRVDVIDRIGSEGPAYPYSRPMSH